MISIDATLAAGLAAGTGNAIIKVEYVHSGGTHTITPNVFGYVIDNMTAETVIEVTSLSIAPITKFRIIRGLNINGIDYTVTSSWFRVTRNIISYTRTALKGTAYTKKRITTAGDISVDTLLGNVFTAAADASLFSYNLALPSDYSEWWRGVQFLPTGQDVILQTTESINNYLRQKYLAQVCNLGRYNDTTNKITVIGANYRVNADIWDHQMNSSKFIENNFDAGPTDITRYWTWMDETEVRHFIGTNNFPLHNLGFIPSTATPTPENNTGLTKSTIRISMPNLAITPGDWILIDDEKTMANVSVREVFNPQSTPAWYQNITEIYFLSGGAQAASQKKITPIDTNSFASGLFTETTEEIELTIEEQVTNAPIQSGEFFNALGAYDNTVQRAFKTLDEHTHDADYVSKSTLAGHMFLPFGVYDSISPITANGSAPFSATVDRTMTLIKWAQGVFIAGTSNGSNYWTIQLKEINGATVLNTIVTSGVSANTPTLLTDTSFSTPSVGASNIMIYIYCTKTGTPGDLYIFGPLLEVSI